MSPAERCRARFLRFFPGGFRDPTYLDWERNYKADAHERWNGDLDEPVVRQLIKARQSQRDRDARHPHRSAHQPAFFVREDGAARCGTVHRRRARAGGGVVRFLHGAGSDERRFDAWRETLEALPRRQTRVFTWPVATVFGFIAQPERHMFLKPNVIRTAAATYGVEFRYQPRPQWSVYRELLDLADRVRSDVRDLGPRDLIDIQSFLWVQGSEEYRGRTFRPAQTKRVRFAVA